MPQGISAVRPTKRPLPLPYLPVRLHGVLGYSFTLLYLFSDSYLIADAWKIVYNKKLFSSTQWPTLTNPGCKILFRDVGYDELTGGSGPSKNSYHAETRTQEKRVIPHDLRRI